MIWWISTQILKEDNMIWYTKHHFSSPIHADFHLETTAIPGLNHPAVSGHLHHTQPGLCHVLCYALRWVERGPHHVIQSRWHCPAAGQSSWLACLSFSQHSARQWCKLILRGAEENVGKGVSGEPIMTLISIIHDVAQKNSCRKCCCCHDGTACLPLTACIWWRRH